MNNTNKRSSIARLILNKLAEVGEATLESAFPRHRAEAMVWRKVLGLPESYEFSPRSFSAVLSRLRQEGLLVKSKKNKRFVWSLTSKGKSSISPIRLPVEPAKTDGIPRLVMYDIPETEKRKREVLRTHLVILEYKQLQKSVWLGYAPLPQEFMELIKDYNLRDKVHILSVHKQGTINKNYKT